MEARTFARTFCYTVTCKFEVDLHSEKTLNFVMNTMNDHLKKIVFARLIRSLPKLAD